MILPAPHGPAVISVIEQRYSNAVTQRVLLSTASDVCGNNFFDVNMFGPMDRSTRGRDALAYRTLRAADTYREVRASLPGVPMRTSGLYLQNNFGPFGYAFGRSIAGDACIYGWQQIRADESERSNFRNSGMIQVRLRLCDRTASEKDLLTVMYGYTLTGGFLSEQWNPYGSPQPTGVAIGAESSPIYPRDSELSAPAPVRVERMVTVRRKVVVKPRVEDEVPLQDEEDTTRPAIYVPSPSGTAEVPDAQEDTSGKGERVLVPSP